MEEKLAPNNPMILEIRELLESARKMWRSRSMPSC